jgi:DNA-binding LytR/AlgR family response regulator
MRFDAWGLVEVYLTVTIVIGLVAYPFSLLAAARRAAEAPPPVSISQPAEEVPLFLRRIPPRLGIDVLSLAAEDHYIRVTTALGSDLILCRLSDAIAELGPAGGQRVHRSYWVAQGAVASVERKDGKTVLLLTNGETVPVSQSYLPSLKAAGWL